MHTLQGIMGWCQERTYPPPPHYYAITGFLSSFEASGINQHCGQDTRLDGPLGLS